jgi:hypothetical protein
MHFTQLSAAFIAFISLTMAAPLVTESQDLGVGVIFPVQQVYARHTGDNISSKKRAEQAYGRHLDENAPPKKRAEQAYGRHLDENAPPKKRVE